METPTTFGKFVEALGTMRKYPKEYKHFKERLAQIHNNFDRLVEEV
jgi:hypothetical protein